MNAWDDERVELLKKLWQEGLSASQIVTEMGGVTRNAVCGKVHRLGLSGRGQPTSSIKRQRRTRPRPKAKPQVSQPMRFGSLVPKSADKSRDNQPRKPIKKPPVSKEIPLVRLEPAHCRWPGDTKPFTFCGHDRNGNGSYCDYHDDISWATGSGKKR